jgi:hypothetical protein
MPFLSLAKQEDSNRPQYLVIFRDSSEKHTSMLSTVLKCGKAKDVKSRSGVEILASGESGVVTRVFERLGIATADLNDKQLESLRKKEEVIDVVENRVRYLPPFRKSIKKDYCSESSLPTMRILAYLQGLRDAADIAISYHQGRAHVSSTPIVGIESVFPESTRSTWGLRAIGITSTSSVPTGKGVKVAVLDTGIDLKHPDLGYKVAEHYSAVSLVEGIAVQDVCGHGTHCAGIICGPTKSINDIRYGTAPDIELFVGKVFNNHPRPGATDDDILEGIAWADDKGVRIISMSLGSDRQTNEPFSPLYENLARRLLERKENSILIVSAAGNESNRPDFLAPVVNPAACPSILSVAAVDQTLNIASFSCRQMDTIGEVDVSSPGVDIYSSYMGGGFESLSGTSMATPFVAGMAALYLEQNPNLTARQIWSNLKLKARKIGDPADFGAGIIRL